MQQGYGAINAVLHQCLNDPLLAHRLVAGVYNQSCVTQRFGPDLHSMGDLGEDWAAQRWQDASDYVIAAGLESTSSIVAGIADFSGGPAHHGINFGRHLVQIIENIGDGCGGNTCSFSHISNGW